MRVFITTFAFLAYASLISAQCQQAATTLTAGYQGITSPNTTAPVTAGSEALIQWQLNSSPPDSKVAFQLCKGPSTNCIPGRCLVESANNNGSYMLQVPSDIAASASPSGGYGLLIITIGSGYFQYSSQFGVLAGSSSSASATLASQITDGQVQVPTGISPKYTPSGSGLYYVPAPTGKVSNTTHSTGFKFNYGPNTAPAGIPINATQYLLSTAGGYAAPTGVTPNPVTSVAIASASANGPIVPSVAPTSTTATSPSNAAGKAVAGGLVAGLGAVAALVL